MRGLSSHLLTFSLFSAWARICKVSLLIFIVVVFPINGFHFKILGPEFAQYLPQVMPAVLQAADFKPDVTVVDDSSAADDDEEWSFIDLGDQVWPSIHCFQVSLFFFEFFSDLWESKRPDWRTK